MDEGRAILFDLTLLNKVLDADREVRIWLVIRHGQKAPAEAGVPFEDIPLSPQGIADSKKLGNDLKASGIHILHISSSPLSRCLATGKYLLEGLGSVNYIHKEDILAYPGSFLADGTLKSVPTVGVRNVLKLVTAAPSHGRTIGLAITHDAVIAPILTYLTRESYELAGNWIDPLDGFALIEKDGLWKVVDHGRSTEITPLISSAISGP